MRKKESFKVGFGFGVTSGTLTTLGLMVGLQSVIESKLVVIGGILTIAVADALSDSLGINLSRVSTNQYTRREVWEATFVTFFTKFFVSLSFVLPLLFFSLNVAVILNIFWGALILGTFSYFIAKEKGIKPVYIISEHLLIASIIIIVAHYIQIIIKSFFY